MSDRTGESPRLTVAELLARNADAATTGGGRRHRHRQSDNSISVAQLTGEMPALTSDVIDAEQAKRNGHGDVAVSKAEAEVSEPELVDRGVVEPEVGEPEPELVEPEPELVEAQLVEPQLVEREVAAPNVREPEAAEPSPRPTPLAYSAGPTGIATADFNSRAVQERLEQETEEKPPAAATAGVATTATPDTDPVGLASPQVTDPEAADPEAADPEVTETATTTGPDTDARPAGATLVRPDETDEAESAGAEPDLTKQHPDLDDPDLEPTDLDSPDLDDTAADEPRQRSGIVGWLILLGEVILGLAVGAALFLGFFKLWNWGGVLPTLVTVALAAAVITAIVVIAHVLRRTLDVFTLALAVLVGLIVTVGPLVTLLVAGSSS